MATNDYGLYSITGVIPTILVAGAATKILDTVFPNNSPKRRVTKRKRYSKSPYLSFINTNPSFPSLRGF